ncbi:MAG: universal stress protein [Candidatus Dormibacteria bacterium]
MYRKIVVGTDGSPSAARAVSQAAELCDLTGAELHIVSAIRVASAALVEASLPVPVAVNDRAWEMDREEALERILGAARADLPASLKVQTHARSGEPGEAILQVANEVGADLIVVGNRGMQGYRRLLGSVPNHISHSSPCSLLIVQTS